MPSATPDNIQNVDAAKRELQAIGAKVVKAVLSKDANTLLSYVVDDNRRNDETDLQDHESDAYCYLFESNCITASKARSVYDIFSSARQLQIEASVTQSKEGRIYGFLLFFDSSRITQQQLQSSAFQCSEESLKTVSSWHFELIDGIWKARMLFDYGTEGLCQEDD